MASALVPRCFNLSTSWLDLAFHLIRPRKKSMRVDVRMKRLSAPYPRNIHKKRDLPHNDNVLRKLFGDS